MTDDEIRQSKIDHYHQQQDIISLVKHSTPSRIANRPRASRQPTHIAFNYATNTWMDLRGSDRR